MIAIDLETACTVDDCPHKGVSACKNKHSLNPWKSEITVIGVACDDGTQRVFRGPNKLVDLFNFIEQRPKEIIVGHNFKFDWLHLAAHGLTIDLNRWQGDSQLAAYVLTDKIGPIWLDRYEEERKKRGPHHRKAGQHSLKTLAPFFLGVEPFWEGADHDDDAYVLKDAQYTLQLVKVLEGHLRERGQFDFYKNKQLPWTKLLVKAELRGVQLDVEGLKELEGTLLQRAAELERTLDKQWEVKHAQWHARNLFEVDAKYEAQKETKSRQERWNRARDNAPHKVDYQSHKQMAWLLKEALGYDITSLEGDESTGREVLERLAAEGHEDIKVFLEWRKVNKLLTSFLPKYLELQHEGTLHPIYNPDTTRTGRTSSERPNAQQVPPDLRKYVTARPGYKYIGYDAAAIEARLIALYSNDPVLYQLIINDISIHDHNVKVFFGAQEPHSQIKKLYPVQRSAAKNCGFALFYNAGANRIRIAFAQKGFPVSFEQCKEIHHRFKESYKVAYEAANDVVRYMESGGIITNLFGRPLKIQVPQDAFMTAFNTLIQSSASDLLLEGATRADEQMRAEGINAHPVLFVHDFVAYEVPEQHVARANEIIVNSLTSFELNTAHGPLPLAVEGGIMDRWEK